MRRFERYRSFRHKFALAAAALLAPLAVPAHAFFPPVPVRVPVHPPKKPPIHVPTPPPPVVKPPVVVPPVIVPPSPPQATPEPTGLVLALLGGGGVSLFAACRRRRPT
jgi:hypothetical protein